MANRKKIMNTARNGKTTKHIESVESHTKNDLGPWRREKIPEDGGNSKKRRLQE